MGLTFMNKYIGSSYRLHGVYPSVQSFHDSPMEKADENVSEI